MRIRKARETMTSRERVLRTFALERTDRVPINYSSNPTIHRKFADALGTAGDHEAFLNALGVDFRGIGAEFVGKCPFPELPGLRVNPVYGFYTRWVENEYGGYDDFCAFPLAGASDEAIDAFPCPDPGEFDVDSAVSNLDRFGDRAVSCGGAGTGDIINSIGRVMGMEDTLVNLLTEHPPTLRLIDRKLDMELGVLARILERAGDRVDFMWLGEDLGTQRAPMIGAELYRRVLRPRHQRFIDLAKRHRLPVMVHTCGASSWVYEDFVEMGVSAVDTLQPEAEGMSPESLTERFGGRLAFHGCISTAGPLAYGSAADAAAYCKRTLEVMMPRRGYFFAPTHAIQDNTPVENLFAMYQAAHDFGRYGS